MFTRRVGRWEVNDFVAALWICRKCSGVGRTAQIRWGTIDVEIEPRGAESRSILPRYVSKNGTACVCDVLIMWNPLHSHIRRSKTKTSSFSSTSPFICPFVADTPTSPQLSTARHPIGWYTPTVNVYSIQLRSGSIISSNCVVLHLLEGKMYRSGISNLPPWVKIGTVAVQSLLLHIIFAQVCHETGQWRKVIRFPCKSWWFSGYLNASWRSVLEFEQTTTQITNNIIKRHWYTTTTWEGYQKASFGIS